MNDIISISKTCQLFRKIIQYNKCESKRLIVTDQSQIIYNGKLIYGFIKYYICTENIPDYIFIKKHDIKCYEQIKNIKQFKKVNILDLSETKIENIDNLENVKILNLSWCENIKDFRFERR